MISSKLEMGELNVNKLEAALLEDGMDEKLEKESKECHWIVINLYTFQPFKNSSSLNFMKSYNKDDCLQKDSLNRSSRDDDIHLVRFLLTDHRIVAEVHRCWLVKS